MGAFQRQVLIAQVIKKKKKQADSTSMCWNTKKYKSLC